MAHQNCHQGSGACPSQTLISLPLSHECRCDPCYLEELLAEGMFLPRGLAVHHDAQAIKAVTTGVHTCSVQPGNVTGHFSWRQPAGLATGTILASPPDQKGPGPLGARKRLPPPAAGPWPKPGVQRAPLDGLYGNGSRAAHAVCVPIVATTLNNGRCSMAACGKRRAAAAHALLREHAFALL